MAVRPWRTGSADPRPPVAVPPQRMPLLHGTRWLKHWHYVGCFGETVMLCAASAHIGPLPLSWWAVWDREQRTLAENTSRARRPLVTFEDDRVSVQDGPVEIALTVGAAQPVETLSPHGRGDAYIWTRKRGGVPISGSVRIGDRRLEVEAAGIVDESAGYHARHTSWRWSAGIGTTEGGDPVAWNLVTGLHDAREASERSVWVAGVPHEVGPVAFDGLEGVRFQEGGVLGFRAESTRAHEENVGLFASSYEQP
jgi:hypothetical protein